MFLFLMFLMEQAQELFSSSVLLDATTQQMWANCKAGAMDGLCQRARQSNSGTESRD